MIPLGKSSATSSNSSLFSAGFIATTRHGPLAVPSLSLVLVRCADFRSYRWNHRWHCRCPAEYVVCQNRYPPRPIRPLLLFRRRLHLLLLRHLKGRHNWSRCRHVPANSQCHRLGSSGLSRPIHPGVDRYNARLFLRHHHPWNRHSSLRLAHRVHSLSYDRGVHDRVGHHHCRRTSPLLAWNERFIQYSRGMLSRRH